MKTINDTYTLNNGLKIPCVGFGTFKSTDNGSADAIKMALQVGYRYLDTASFYHNEEFVAQAIRESGLRREELFLVTKAWKTQMGYQEVKAAFQESLKKLETEYVDLYLIHWPVPEVGYKDWKQLDIDTWKALEELYADGKVKGIGVSNFLPHHLENLMQHTEVKPVVNQIEFHPGYTQEATVEYCQRNDILVQAWSPLGRTRVLNAPFLVELAEKYGVSTARLCIRYAIQRGVLPIPKASSMERIKENQKVFDFEISNEDMYRISTLPQMGWSGLHPDFEREG